MGDTLVHTCRICGDEFAQISKRGRPRNLCSAACKKAAGDAAVARYRKTEKYRAALRRNTETKKEKFNPWLWENTILEWNE